MPYPLAHPAAVLPLRRFCPQWLSFPALVVGSISPDIGYVFAGLKVQEFSHEFMGGIVFCLPAGLLLLLAHRCFGCSVVKLLPTSCQRVLLPCCQHSLGSLSAVVVSLLIGISAHQLLDAITHKDGWLAAHSVILQIPVVQYGHQTLRVCHCLWYLLSFTGIIWVGLVYQRWVAGIDAASKLASGKVRLVNAVLLATSVMLVSAAFRITHHWSAIFAEGALSSFILIVFLVRTGPR